MNVSEKTKFNKRSSVQIPYTSPNCDMHLFEIKMLYVAHRRKSEDRKLSMQKL